MVKNATGYDLRQLFIGSEGTLGFITEVELNITRPPQATTVLVFGLEKMGQVIDVYQKFRDSVELSACEVFSDFALTKVIEMHDLQRPFETDTPFYLLLEVEHNSGDQSETLAPLFEECFEKGWISDGVISQSPSQAKDLWNLREFISESISPMSPYRNDVSVRTSKIPEFADEIEREVQKSIS